MPSIDEKIKAQAELVDSQLAHLPELPNENVQHVVRQCLQSFSNGVQRLLEGGQASNEFLSEWTQLSLDFAEVIQLMKPKFVITDASDSALPEVISLDDDSDNSSRISSPRSQVPKRQMENPSTPVAKRQTLDPRSGSFAAPGFLRSKNEGDNPVEFRRPSNGKKSTPFDKYQSAGKRFMTIAEVRTIISKHRRPGHPGIVTDSAREEICLMSLWPWDGPLQVLSDVTFQKLRSAVLRVMDRTLGHYRQTDLFRLARRKILESLGQHQADQRRSLNALYALETYKLFTLNEPAFLKYQQEELKILQAKRREIRVSCYVKKQAALSKKALSDVSRLQLEKSVTDDELGPDPFKLEIETAAYVRGYYRTAGYRFSDNLCQSILGNLLKNIQKEIPFLLETHFELNRGDSKYPVLRSPTAKLTVLGELKCRNLMVEDHGEAAQRAVLQDQKSKLNQAAERLARLVEQLQSTSNGVDPDSEDDTMEDEDNQTDGQPN